MAPSLFFIGIIGGLGTHKVRHKEHLFFCIGYFRRIIPT